MAGAALASRHVELEVRVAAGNPRRSLEIVGAQGRPPEVGVQEHTGGIDHGLQQRRLQVGAALPRVGDDGVDDDGATLRQQLARVLDGAARARNLHSVWERDDAHCGDDAVDARELAPLVHDAQA
jgi:hypothetical protein